MWLHMMVSLLVNIWNGKKKNQEKSPDTVEEVAVIVSIDVKIIPYAVVQHTMAVLEVVEDTQDGTVVVVWG